MKKTILRLLPVIIGLFSVINAGAAVIKGYVYDKKTNEPIIGAIVTLSGQNIGAHTDFDGRFVIKDVPIGQERLLVKSMGYRNHTQSITVENDSVEIDMGRIDMNTAKSKHYNRITWSYNPQLIPTICNHQKMFYNSFGVVGASLSYLHGYNVSEKFGVELGAKYNYTFDENESVEFHSQSKHHSLSVFANVAYNIAINEVTLSPYVGVFTRKYIYSKVCYGTSSRCSIYDFTEGQEEKWFNPGAQLGLGIKYRRLYLGAELGCDLNQEKIYYMESSRDNRDEFHMEYSFSVGFEF